MITLTYPAVIVTPSWVDRLVRICTEHQGDESVELHLFGPPCDVLRLNVYVDGSPEFLLKAMGLLD